VPQAPEVFGPAQLTVAVAAQLDIIMVQIPEGQALSLLDIQTHLQTLQ
jgi:hypothetical protein